jgi:hypothetical protein
MPETKKTESKFTLTISMGRTIDLGGYNSGKLHIGVSQSEVAPEDRDATLINLQNYVRNELAALVEIVEREMDTWPK